MDNLGSFDSIPTEVNLAVDYKIIKRLRKHKNFALDI
jgi:hypothetical protein